MTYAYVLTIQILGYNPIPYKGTCVPVSPVTSSGLLDFVTEEFMKALGHPVDTPHAVIFWQCGPDSLGGA